MIFIPREMGFVRYKIWHGWTGSSFRPIPYLASFFEGKSSSRTLIKSKTLARDGLGSFIPFACYPFFLPPFDILALIFLIEQTWLGRRNRIAG